MKHYCCCPSSHRYDHVGAVDKIEVKIKGCVIVFNFPTVMYGTFGHAQIARKF